MKKILMLLTLALASLPLGAQEPDPAADQAQPQPAFLDQVKALQPMNGVAVNADAEYYVFLFSARWCGPCRQEMPGIVEAYKGLKAAGRVEIILMDCSGSVNNCEDFQKSFSVTFPALEVGDGEGKLNVFKDVKVRGIPHMVVFSKDGRLVTRAHPAALLPDLGEAISRAEAEGKG